MLVDWPIEIFLLVNLIFDSIRYWLSSLLRSFDGVCCHWINSLLPLFTSSTAAVMVATFEAVSAILSLLESIMFRVLDRSFLVLTDAAYVLIFSFCVSPFNSGCWFVFSVKILFGDTFVEYWNLCKTRIYIINSYGGNLKFYEWNSAQFSNQYMSAEAGSISLQSTINNKSEHIFRFEKTI